MRGDVYTLILNAVKPLALEKFGMYQAVHEYLISLVKDVIAKHGVDYAITQEYMWYAQRLWYLTQHYKGEALQIEADATFLYYFYRGRNEQILREIANRLGIKISSWDTLLGRLGMSEEAIYRGTKRALQETLHGIEVNPANTFYEYDPNTGLLVRIVQEDAITGKKKIIRLVYDQEGRLVSAYEEWE
ncbi:MAG: hypothetical protein DRI26_01070 [Chloroflexi bacterium]|nr:MAG: hypothetical protein DRI26_01070 [Chloroflexota bacterium]